MKKAILASLNKKFFFIVAIFAIVFSLTIGVPNPPGFLLQVSQNYLESMPGYHDVKTGAINPQLIDQNIDAYNQYLLATIIIIPLNIIVYYALFILASVLVWNYILQNTLSLRGYWRSFFINLLLLLFTTFVGFLAYVATTFLGSLGATWWDAIMSALFAFIVIYLILLTLFWNYYLQKKASFVESITYGLTSLSKNILTLGFGIIVNTFILFCVSFLYFIPSVSLSLITAFLALVQLVFFAWFQLYIAALLDEKSAKKKHN